MSKISLNNISAPENVSLINDNFQKIANEFDKKVLYRDNLVNEPNEMKNALDMNGKRVYNLPAPIAENEPARYKEIKDVRIEIDQAHLDAQKAKEEADRAEREADRAFQSAVYGGANNLKVFETFVEAQIAAATLPNGQKVEVESEHKRYLVEGGALLFVENFLRSDLVGAEGSSLVGYDGGTVQDVLDSVKPVADYTELRAYTGHATGVLITTPGIAGYFRYDSSNTTSVDNGGTLIVGIDGRRWERLFGGNVLAEWFGVTRDSADNSSALQKALNASAFTTLVLPPYEVKVNLSQLSIPSFSTIKGTRGLTVLRGPDADTSNIADGTGYMMRSFQTSFVTLRDFTLKNGYKGRGLSIEGCSDVLLEDMTFDGFTYGAWIAEDEWGGKGSQRVKIIRPRVLNTRYWGIYVRGYEITNDSNKTRDILIQDPYCYRISMAALVLSEGNIRDVKIVRPVAETCNLHMHIEGASNYTVIDPTDRDIGKKPWMVPSNTEYPFTGWSIYHIFAEGGSVIGGKLSAACYHSASIGPVGNHGHQMRCINLSYTGTRATSWIFEGVGETQDTDQNAFESITLDGCVSSGPLIYQQPSDMPNSFIRLLTIRGGECLLGMNGNSGSGSYVAVSLTRSHTVTMDGVSVRNACVRMIGRGLFSIRNNKFLGGTDQTQNQFNGWGGGVGSGNYLDFCGNQFEYAGGSTIGDSAILIQNWSAVRADNKLNGNSAVNYLYRFTDNYRVEYAQAFGIGEIVAKYIETGTSDFRQAY